MMRISHTLVSLFAVFLTAAAAAAAEKRPVFSTTIDFQDYIFFDKEARGKSYYPLELYESRIREMAEGGIKKIYLRVNVCGLTEYPTKVAAQYGTDGAFHWAFESGALRAIETYKHYNPLTETIRLGHKYGMEVWAWESLFDDAGLQYEIDNCPQKYREYFRRLNGWPLMDPFYRDNMDAFAMRDPRLEIAPAKFAAINREARKNPIARIVFTNREKCSPITMTAADFKILTSPDNVFWTPLEKPFDFKTSVTQDGFNRFEITGLEITDPYVKFVRKRHDESPNFSIVLSARRGQGEVYDNTGRLVQSVWEWLSPNGEQSPIQFGRLTLSAAVDYGYRQLAFVVGEPPPQRWFLGMAELNVPKAMKHKLDRFAELAEYPFDGFMFNIRCHSVRGEPEQYGYNPEVRKKYLERYGKDIWRDKIDVAKLFLIRAEAIADFFKGCKRLAGNRPIYLSGPHPDYRQSPNYGTRFGPLPWLYKRYFADGSIDGVTMILRSHEKDFRDFFTDEITGGKPIKFGIFREMEDYRLLDKSKVLDDLRRLKQRRDLDEIELYETLILTENPEIYRVIREP